MPKAKLTKTYLEKLTRGATDVIHWDTEARGFGAKVTPKGKIVFLVQYRPSGHAGHARKFTIGPLGSVTVDQARTQAKDIMSKASGGADPQRQKRETRHKLASDRIEDVVKRFLADHAAQNRTHDEAKRILEREFVKPWSGRSVHDLSRKDVIAALDAIKARAPVMANRALAHVRKFFNWCVAKAILERSPAEGVGALSKERARDRTLTDDELRAIILAAREIAHPFGSLVEMLALTGQRRDEVARCEWSHIDMDAGIWTIPGEHAKNGKAHIVHLSEPALVLLRGVPCILVQDDADGSSGQPEEAQESKLVFTTNGKTPFQGFSKAKARLDKIALAKICERAAKQGANVSKVTLPDWRLHDLRRTMVTGMARMGVAHHVADKVLNHQSGTISGVAAVYQQHEFMPEREAAMRVWGQHVQGLLTDKPSNVVPIKRVAESA